MLRFMCLISLGFPWNHVIAADPVASPISDYAFEGVKVGMKYQDFIKKYPDALIIRGKLPMPKGYLQLKQDASETAASHAYYSFYEGELYEIAVWYNEEGVKSIGGEAVLKAAIQKKFGKPSYSSKKLGDLWQFPLEDREVVYVGDVGNNGRYGFTIFQKSVQSDVERQVEQLKSARKFKK